MLKNIMKVSADFLCIAIFVFLTACGGSGTDETITIAYELGKQGGMQQVAVPDEQGVVHHDSRFLQYPYPEKGNFIKMNALKQLEESGVSYGNINCGYIDYSKPYVTLPIDYPIDYSYLFVEINKSNLVAVNALGFFPVHEGPIPVSIDSEDAASSKSPLNLLRSFVRSGDIAVEDYRDLFYKKAELTNTYCYPD